MADIQLNVSAAEIDSAVLDHKNSTIAASKSAVNTTGFTDATLTNSQLVAQAVDTNQTNLNSIRDQYELLQYFTNIPNGTSGQFTAPTGYTYELDRFGNGVDAIIAKVGSDSRPTDELVKTESGVIVTATLDSDGNYTILGIPSAYPVSLVYYLKGQRKNRGNITFDNILETIDQVTKAQVELALVGDISTHTHSSINNFAIAMAVSL